MNLKVSLSDFAEFAETTPDKIKKRFKKVLGYELANPSLTSEEARALYLDLGRAYPQKVVSIQMLKGGVAKTTTTLNLGLRAAMMGARVLFVDLDQQANLSFSLGVEDESLPVWIDIFEKKKVISECVRHLDAHVDLIPSSLNNSVLERSLMNASRNWAQAVNGPLSEIKHRYDLILIDTAPALSLLNTAVTLASTQVILPVNPDRFSYLGLKKNMEELSIIEDDFKHEVDKKILFTRFDAREKTSHEIWNLCRSEFGDCLLETYIRTSTEVKNSIGTGKNIFAKNSGIKEDFDQITGILLAPAAN